MTKFYGLVGYPLGHSFSQAFFREKFAQERIDADYENFELCDISHLREFIAEYPLLDGFNVTIPYKEQIIPLLDDIDPIAREIGAINVVRIDRQGDTIHLTGFNTDVIGFTHSIAPMLQPGMEKALVLGTGGASKAVCAGLHKLGITHTLVSRKPGNDILSYHDLTAKVMHTHRIIVNTTPLGMFPHTESCPDIPYSHLTPAHLCYDVVYNPEETLFLQKAAQQGCIVKGGVEMLHRQALAAWEIWNR